MKISQFLAELHVQINGFILSSLFVLVALHDAIPDKIGDYSMSTLSFGNPSHFSKQLPLLYFSVQFYHIHGGRNLCVALQQRWGAMAFYQG